MGILLSDIFDPRSIKLDLESTGREAAFAELVGTVAALHPGLDPGRMLSAIVAREDRMSTGIAPGVAVPHARYKEAPGIIGAIGVSRTGIEYDAPDGKPVHAVFLLLIGERAEENHLRALNLICTLANSDGLALIRRAQTPQQVLTVLADFPAG